MQCLLGAEETAVNEIDEVPGLREEGHTISKQIMKIISYSEDPTIKKKVR